MLPRPPLSTLFPYTTLFRSFWALNFRLLRTTRRSKRSRKYLRSEEHTSELQSLAYLVCRLLLEKKKHSMHAEFAGLLMKRLKSPLGQIYEVAIHYLVSCTAY